MKTIVSVCRGNIARSAVAEKIIEKELQSRGLSYTFVSISRGIQGTIVDPEPVKFPNITYYKDLFNDSEPTLKKFNIDLSSHVSKPIDKDTAEKASILLAVDHKAKESLITLFPNLKDKIHMLSSLIDKDVDIIDPEGISGKEKQEKIFTEIKEIILMGFPKLLKLLSVTQ